MASPDHDGRPSSDAGTSRDATTEGRKESPLWGKEKLGPELANVDFYDVWGASANDVYAVGDTGVGGSSTGIVAHFTNGSWTRIAMAPSPLPLRGVSGVSGVPGSSGSPAGTTAFAVGSGNALVTCAGTTCKSVTCLVNGASADFKGVWAASASQALIAGQEILPTGSIAAVVYRFSGTCAREKLELSIPTFNAIWGTTPDKYFAVSGKAAGVTGAFWELNGPITHVQGAGSLNDAWGANGQLLMVGDAGMIATHDLATTGEYFAKSPGVEALYGVWTDGNQALAVGAGRAVLKRPTTSGNWSPETLPAAVASNVELRAVWGDTATGEIFVVGKQGTILHYR